MLTHENAGDNSKQLGVGGLKKKISIYIKIKVLPFSPAGGHSETTRLTKLLLQEVTVPIREVKLVMSKRERALEATPPEGLGPFAEEEEEVDKEKGFCSPRCSQAVNDKD